MEFFIAKSLEQGAFAHRMADGYFLPLLPVASLSNAQAKEFATNVVKKMTEMILPQANEKIWQKWHEIEPLSAYSATPKSTLFANFVRAEYFRMLHDAVIEYEEVKALEFQPKYDINVGNSDVHEQRNRQDLIDRAVPEDGHAVEKLAIRAFRKQHRRITSGDANFALTR